MDGSSDEVVKNARQVGWLGLAMIVVGFVVGGAGSAALGGVMALVGFALFVGTRYLIGRYG